MSAELARLKGLRRERMRDLVERNGYSNSQAFEACWQLTEQIAEQVREDAFAARVAADIEAGKVVTFTVGPETAANIHRGRVPGMSIDLPRPVAAKDHVMFHESTRFPGVVWPL